MKYGCIGEHLTHSFSKQIHNLLADYCYELCEIPQDKLSEFMAKKDFLGINVTIPYKEAVIPYLSFLDEGAKKIGAVNTVVNRAGVLYGYNTDFLGLKALILRLGIDLHKKKVAILGTGGTSKTAVAVATALGAGEILTVSRKEKDSAITYSELKEKHSDTDFIINTTPCGMFPRCDEKPIELSSFPSLLGLADVIYNPLRSALVCEAKERGIKAEGGLYMLVAQAVYASEIFTDTKYPEGTIDRIYREILKSKENIVLIGMPSSGKSTVGEILSERLNRKLIDTDKKIIETKHKEIKDIFLQEGEDSFRNAEISVIKDVSSENDIIIATGGGAVLKKENVERLKRNGKIYFIDRPLNMLFPTHDRPLSSNQKDIERLYNERYEIYRTSADVTVNVDIPNESCANKIMGDFLE